MNRLLIIVCATLATSGALPGVAAAASCRPSNVQGLWALRSIAVQEPNTAAFYKRAPFEYLRIRPGMDFIHVASPVPRTVEQLRPALEAADAADGVTYTLAFPDRQALLIFRDERPFQGFRCHIADAPGQDTDVGDMIWTELPGGSPVRRVHRRVTSPE